jgi:hypothetical protein
VSQHHDGGQEKRSGVSELLALNVGCGTVDSLEDGALVTNVSGRSKTKTTNETGAHIRQNVSVQVGHNEDLVVVGSGVGDHLQAGVVQQLSVKVNVGELLGDLTGGAEEKTVGHLHDGGLVHSADLLPANVASVLESVSQNTLGGLAGDELDALHNAVNNNVLDAGVLSLGVLTDQDGVDIVVGCLVASDRSAWSDVGEEVEGTAESQVERDVALSDGCCERALERNQVLLDTLNGLVGDNGLAVLVQAGGDVDGFPLDRDVRCRVDVLDRLRDLGTDTVSLDESDAVLAVAALCSVELGDLSGVGTDGSLTPYVSGRPSCLYSHWRPLATPIARSDVEAHLR